MALTNGPAAGSKRHHSSDEDAKAEDQEKAAQNKRRRVSESPRPVLMSGTSNAKQLGVLVKQKRFGLFSFRVVL